VPVLSKRVNYRPHIHSAVLDERKCEPDPFIELLKLLMRVLLSLDVDRFDVLDSLFHLDGFIELFVWLLDSLKQPPVVLFLELSLLLGRLPHEVESVADIDGDKEVSHVSDVGHFQVVLLLLDTFCRVLKQDVGPEAYQWKHIVNFSVLFFQPQVRWLGVVDWAVAHEANEHDI
jgi:hypothetical protein